MSRTGDYKESSLTGAVVMGWRDSEETEVEEYAEYTEE